MSKAEQEFIDVVAREMASAVCEAVGHWMADIGAVLESAGCTTQQKLDEIAWIVSEYKAISHNRDLRPRTAALPPDTPPQASSVTNGI